MRAFTQAHLKNPAPRALGRLSAVDPGLLALQPLLRRADTKFVLPRQALEPLLDQLSPHFGVVESSGRRLASYATQYFDTPDLRCYHDHRRGVRPRHKIRIRHYRDRAQTFLEIKTRRGMVSDKQRFPREVGHPGLDFDDRELIAGLIGLDDLVAQAWTLYSRATLVALDRVERLTIDTDIELRTEAGAGRLDRVAIVEVKQPRRDNGSPAMQALRRLAHRPLSISKYCTAVAATREVRCGRLTYGLRRLAAIG